MSAVPLAAEATVELPNATLWRTRRRFTVDDYYRMAEVGLLAQDERTELLDGEVVFKMPIGSRHAGCVNWLGRTLGKLLGDRAIVASQNPVRLDRYSEPEPDIAVLKPRPDDYRRSHPEPRHVLLLIEVADSSVQLDRRIKASLYAAAGIPELWLVDLTIDTVEVHRDPGADRYRHVEVLRRGETLSLAGLLDVSLDVDELLGPVESG